MTRPNLFNYATSELSQDAFICWILSWATSEAGSYDKQLNEISHRLLKAFFYKHNREFPSKIEKLEIKKQYQNIDVLVIVNDTIAIPIEDKIHVREHSDQLTRYLQTLRNDGFEEKNLLPIYLQTGEQGDYRKVKEAGFIPFLRTDLLETLREGRNYNNTILTDYLEFLETIEKQVQSFKHLTLGEWNWYSWQGFYNYLQDKLDDGEWDYVSNPRGGFLGFWWHWQGDDDCEQYLQLEEDKLCFKISVDDPDKRTDLKWKWNERIQKAGENSPIKITKPVLRNGQWMTVTILDGDYRQTDNEGKIDLDKTLEVIREAERVLDRAMEYKSTKNVKIN